MGPQTCTEKQRTAEKGEGKYTCEGRREEEEVEEKEEAEGEGLNEDVEEGRQKGKQEKQTTPEKR